MKFVRPVALGTALALGYGVVKVSLNNEEKEHIGSIGSIAVSPNIAISNTASVTISSPAILGPGLSLPTDQLYHVYVSVAG